MYCVQCGKKAADGEKRCAGCNMRLVTARRLTRLLQEDEARRAGPWFRFKRKLRRAAKKARPVLAAAFSACGQGIRKLAAWICMAAASLWLYIKSASVFGWKKTKSFFMRLGTWTSGAAGKLRARTQPAVKRLRKKCRIWRKRLKKRIRKLKNTYFPGPEAAADGAAKIVSAKPQTAARNVKPGAQAVRKPEASGPKASIQQRLERIKQYALSEKHLRSTVAMGLLAAALLAFLGWSTLSDSGRMTYARLGVGSARGYILLGDECMENGNYTRAVENYYASISKRAGYEAAIKLAAAYSYTGDVSREVSALLYCAETYPQYKASFEQLLILYPDGSARPPRVQAALEKGIERFGLE